MAVHVTTLGLATPKKTLFAPSKNPHLEYILIKAFATTKSKKCPFLNTQEWIALPCRRLPSCPHALRTLGMVMLSITTPSLYMPLKTFSASPTLSHFAYISMIAQLTIKWLS
ncbi:hypothetical protein AMTRI_Chr09g15150 [Amborella trichopoda]